MPPISVSSLMVHSGGTSLAKDCTIRKHRLHSRGRCPRVEGFVGTTRFHTC
jgi:hypothetical protein